MRSLKSEKKSMEELVKNYLSTLYKKISPNFPSIVHDFSFEYDPSELIIFSMFNDLNKKMDNLTIKPKIRVGDRFFLLSPKEHEATVAHEIGHYLYFMKHPHINRWKRMLRWNKEFYDYLYSKGLSRKIKDAIIFWSFKKRMKISKIEKWIIMKEIYADNIAFEAGYGETSLKLLKRVKNNLYNNSDPLYQIELNARIKNLEEKLKY